MSQEGLADQRQETYSQGKRGDNHQSTGQTIKEFAETAMNELLGLYGYGKVDSRDTLGLSLHRFTNHSPPEPAHTAGSNSPLRSGNQSPSRHLSRPSPPLSVSHSPPQPHGSDQEHDADSLDSDGMPVPVGQLERGVRSVSPGKTEPGSGSSRDSTPKSDGGGGGGGTGGGGPGVVLCSWCGRVCSNGGRRGGGVFQLSTTSGDRHFCSEVCFTQCRRASFKKSKVCDWCRHVRPTVTYVDFTDGDHQLQFCSDKCLNQYKMQIFCRETEAHLQMHPHLNDLKPASSGGLITPDLWLRDCGGQGSENDSGPENELHVGSPPSSPIQQSTTPPCISPDPMEPVNLTTQSNNTKESYDTPSLSRRSPAAVHQGGLSSKSTEAHSPGPLPTPRYGRPRLRDRRDSGRDVGRPRTVRASLQMARAAQSDADKSDDPIRLPTIRVRQLESQQQQQQQQQDQPSGERELPSSSSAGPDGSSDSSPHPTAQPPGLPLASLGGGLGGLLPMVGGTPLLLPHMLPQDLPRTPLLPHLLLQHPELLRPPPLRHPLLPPAPAPAPHTPAPPTAVPQQPPTSIPPPHVPPKPPGSLLPPVTVLLPCPIPVPIPIPIPVPIPIPIRPQNDTVETRPTQQTQMKEAGGRPRPAARKDSCRSGSVITRPAGGSSSSGSVTQSSTSATTSAAVAAAAAAAAAVAAAAAAPPPPPPTSASSDTERNALMRPDRERRSILRYTSDVYEINGMFLPRDSAWDAPEPLQLRRALVGDSSSHDSPYGHPHSFDSHNMSRTPSPDPGEDSKDALVCLTRKREEEMSTVKRLLGEDTDNDEEAKKSREPTETETKSPSPNSTATNTTTTTTISASNRKRHSASSEHQQPLPKKKHLLV